MPVGHDTLSFFLGSFAVPALLVVVNFLIRDSAGWFYTAGTDILFSLMAFNLSSAVLASDVAPYIHDEKMRTAAVGIFVVAGLLDLIAWLLALRKVEVRIHNALRAGHRLSPLSQFLVFLSWAVVVSFTGLQFLVFTYH